MKTARRRIVTGLGWVLAAVLTACGGGGDDIVVGTGAGIYKGSADGGRAVTAVVLEDGNYYLVYSTTADAGVAGGGVQGTFTLSAPVLTSSGARNYNLEGSGTQAASFAGNLDVGRSLSGTFTSGTAGTLGVTTEYSRDSGDRASLATLAGAYPGQVTFALGVRPAVFNVTAEGAVSTVINGCTITGTVAPRADINAFDLTIAFAGPPCVIPSNLPFTGVAYLDTATGQLTSFVRNTAAGQGIFFRGTKS
jgi:hypothetical protein